MEGRRSLTLSHSSGESSSPCSWPHRTQRGAAPTSAGCLGRSENLSFGLARSSVVFCPGMMLEIISQMSVEAMIDDRTYSKISMPSKGMFFVGFVALFGSSGPSPSSPDDEV